MNMEVEIKRILSKKEGNKRNWFIRETTLWLFHFFLMIQVKSSFNKAELILQIQTGIEKWGKLLDNSGVT